MAGHGGEAGSICFWNFNSMLVLGSICFAEFPRAKFRLHSTPHSPSSDKTLQTSPPPHVCLCVVTMRKKESTHSVQFYVQIFFFLLNLFDVRWPNEIWWHIFQENVVEEDECQQLCGDQVTIFIAPDPSPIIIALPCPSACPSLMLFWIHWWLLSASDVTKAMLASLSNSLV